MQLSNKSQWALAVVIVGVIAIASFPREETPNPVVEVVDPTISLTQGVEPSEQCIAAFSKAAAEPDSTKAEPLLADTADACPSRQEWYAGLALWPLAMGYLDKYSIDGTELATLCFHHESRKVCKISK